MSTWLFTVIVGAGSVVAGLLGSLTGLGGGVVIVPLLALGLKVDLHYAIGASLISVIATSSGAAAAYVREGFTNLRIGMFLEMATTLGAVSGAFLAGWASGRALGFLFGILLLHSAYLASRPRRTGTDKVTEEGLGARLRMEGVFPTPEGPRRYHAQRVPAAFGVMFVAGVLSGLLGIGSGALKVLAMDQVMRLPFKVSTATSNFMIGVTAAAGAGVYLRRGYVDPGVALPVMLGVLAGSVLGARLLAAAQSRRLRLLFGGLVFLLGLEMIRSSLMGGL